MRLIDADALEARIEKAWENKAITDEEYADISGYAEDAPTIDPVKHGRWKNKQMLDENLNPTIAFRHRCSECRFEICTTDEMLWWHYCPYCGAKMDGGEG